MSDPLGKVHRGEAFSTAAQGRNAMLEAARAAKTRRFGEGSEPPAPPPAAGTVLVRNVSGADVGRFGVLALGEPTIDPAEQLEAFAATPCFDGELPADGHRNFAITQEPLAQGAIGRAIVAGVTQARVVADVGAEGLHFADMVESNSAALALGESGHGEVLWREGGTGEQWATIRIDNAPVAVTWRFAIVRTPYVVGGTATLAEDGYTLDVYGKTIDSLDESPAFVGVEATQTFGPRRFWPGELVVAELVDDAWQFVKLAEHEARLEVEPGEVGFRVEFPDFTAPDLDDRYPSNVLVDLVDLLAYTGVGVVTFHALRYDWGGYTGVAEFWSRCAVRIPPGATLAELVDVHDQVGSGAIVNAVNAALLGTLTAGATAMASSGYAITTAYVPGDLFFEPWQKIREGEDDVSGNGWVYPYVDEIGNEFAATLAAVLGELELRWQPLDDDSFWTNLPALASIPDAIDDTRIPLLLLRASMRDQVNIITGGTITHPNPQVTAYRTIPAGGASLVGTYDVQATVVSSNPVAPWIEVA